MGATEDRSDIARESDDAFNAFLLHQRADIGYRPRLRIGIEVWARKRSKLSYIRMRGTHWSLSLPSVEQAYRVIAVVDKLIRGLDGVFLAEPEAENAPAEAK
jgi:hypothetical protein